MKSDKIFTSQSSHFWAYVRLLSQGIGYTDRVTKSIRAYNYEEIKTTLIEAGLGTEFLLQDSKELSDICKTLILYFKHRADILNNIVKNNLMDKNKAESLFRKLKKELKPNCPLPMNKQRGSKKQEAYFTCIINMLIEKNLQGKPVDYDPRSLPIVLKDNNLVKTFSRRIDGAYPSIRNPIAVWEIKEYYNTTTFGSRVADAVYETQLDGLEIEELLEDEGIKVLHYLFIDDYYTWWGCGKSYLCRLIDILHMGYIDELVIGKEVVEAIPKFVEEWKKVRVGF